MEYILIIKYNILFIPRTYFRFVVDIRIFLAEKILNRKFLQIKNEQRSKLAYLNLASMGILSFIGNNSYYNIDIRHFICFDTYRNFSRVKTNAPI